MSTRLSMRMTCALLAGVAATVGFATPVVAQSSDLSSSFSKPSKPEAPKPSEKPAEKPTSEAPTPPAPDANKQSEAVLGKGYKATTKCEGRDGISILSSLHRNLPSTMWFCMTYTTFKSSQSQ